MTAAPAMPALAGPRQDVQAASARCDSVADDRAWLDCYYGAAQPMRGQLGLPPAPVSQQMLVPAAGPQGVRTHAMQNQNNAAPAAKPGFFARLYQHADIKAEPPTRMTSYRFENGGYFVVVLANGETWKQVVGDTALANWRDRPERYTVTIVPAGQLGIMNMKVGNAVYQVEKPS
jgi:hypothetical protein